MRTHGDNENHPLLEPVTACTVDPESGEELAWKLHGALQDWTGKVDTKASIVMTLETALLSAIVAFSRARVSEYSFNWAALHRFGLILLFVSVILAGTVVFPQLDRRISGKSRQNGFIYFGDLRKWDPTALAEAILGVKPTAGLQMLSEQLVAMSRIVWRKHVLVQWSLLAAFAGCLAVGIPLIATS